MTRWRCLDAYGCPYPVSIVVNSLVSSKFSAEDDATTNLPGSSTLFDNFPPLLMSSGVFRHDATDEQLFLRFSSFPYHQLDCHLILCNAVEKYLFIIHQFICQLSWALGTRQEDRPDLDEIVRIIMLLLLQYFSDKSKCIFISI